MNEIENGKFEHEFVCSHEGQQFWKFLLTSFICAMLSILSTSTLNAEGNMTVFAVFVGVLLIMFAIYDNGFWGILTAAFSSLLFCISIRTPVVDGIINICANTLQAVCLYVAIHRLHIDAVITKKSKYVSDYLFLLGAFGIAYVVASFMFGSALVLYLFFGLAALMATAFCIYEKSFDKLKFFLFTCFIPSAVGGGINAISTCLQTGTAKAWWGVFRTWSFSNTILIATFGFVILRLLSNLCKKEDESGLDIAFKADDIKNTEKLKLSTMLYYVATFAWNILFYGMYLYGWLGNKTPTYIFPWTVGNAFFLANLYFSIAKEVQTESEEDAFSWFEHRAVVAESNTQMIIAIIAFLLPLCAQYFGSISESIWFVFILNITTAVISIGLIWVPQNNVRIMMFIKTFKTIFHLFTLSLLLLNTILIINNVAIA